ncbi:MAG: DUF2087 domain-containing protein [Firmicutes bacterium]|nr:DUF2087 domain-containing protein [Bacillota bacterium]
MERVNRISRIPKKQKRRLGLLRRVIASFEPGREYTEKEVNELLREVYPDYVELRRCLVDDRLLDRLPDGSRYWVSAGPTE